MDDSKIIKFPSERIYRDIPPEAIAMAKERGKIKSAEYLANEIAGYLYTTFEEYGIDTEADHFDKDWSFTVATIRALVFRQFEINHDLHKFIDACKIVETQSEKDTILNSLPSDVEASPNTLDSTNVEK